MPRGTFYKLNVHRYSWSETLAGNPWYLLPLLPLALLMLLVMRILRTRPNVSVVDPKVESLRPFEIGEAVQSGEMRAKLAAMDTQLRAIGFGDAVCYDIDDAPSMLRFYRMAMTEPSGRAFGRLTAQIWNGGPRTRTRVHCEFISRLGSGRFQLTMSAQADIDWPEGVQVQRFAGMEIAELWRRHQQAIAARTLTPIAGPEQMREVEDALHDVMRLQRLRRGVYELMTEQETQTLLRQEEQAAAMLASGPPVPEGAPASGPLDTAMLAELERLQTRRSNGLTGLVVLVITLAAFAGAGFTQSWGSTIWLLIPILLFHELGHYAAMKVFGYRDVRMFFIPFLGAAVSGRNLTAPGWKAAIVALAGPVPGIVLGAALGVFAALTRRPLLQEAGLLALIVNGLNLLPILPLDGGRVVHAVLFSRNAALDGLFRVVAALALLGGFMLLHDKVLMALGIVMLLGLLPAFKLAKIATQLRKEGLPPPLPGTTLVPVSAAHVIAQRVKGAFGKTATAKTVAAHVLRVYESVNARPPSVEASIGLLALHALAFGGALVAMVVLMLVGTGRLARPQPPAEMKLVAEDIQRWDGSRSATISRAGRMSVVSNFESADLARRAFESTKLTAPQEGALRLYGQTIIAAFPSETPAPVVKAWERKIRAKTRRTWTYPPETGCGVQLTCTARSDQEASEIEEQLDGYLTILAAPRVLPPWLLETSVPASDRERFVRARKTIRRLIRDAADASLGSERPSDGVPTDPAKLREFVQAQTRAAQTAKKAAVQKLLQAAPADIDMEVAKRYAPLCIDDIEWTEQLEVYRALAPLLGQLPEGALAEARVCARDGNLERNQRTLQVQWIQLVDPADGMEALVKWLKARGCDDFHYVVGGDEGN